MSLLGSASGAGRVGAALLKDRLIAGTALAGMAVLVAGCGFAATAAPSPGPASLSSTRLKSAAELAPVSLI